MQNATCVHSACQGRRVEEAGTETANCSERGLCVQCTVYVGGAGSGGGSSTGRESATEGIRREICRQHHLCKIMSA